MSLIFEDPPPREYPGGKGRPEPSWVTELKANPGQWARLPVKLSNPTYYRTRGIEMTGRTVNGQKIVYGRYISAVGEHA